MIKGNKHELDSCILSNFLKPVKALWLCSWQFGYVLRVVTGCLKFIGFIIIKLHQTSKFASGSKMYIFWYRLIGLLQPTYTAHETKYWLGSCWNSLKRVLGSSLSLRIIVKASCRCSTCLNLQTNLNSLSPNTIKTISLWRKDVNVAKLHLLLLLLLFYVFPFWITYHSEHGAIKRNLWFLIRCAPDFKPRGQK